MARSKVSSRRMATKAAKALRNTRANATTRSLAGSVLSQYQRLRKRGKK